MHAVSYVLSKLVQVAFCSEDSSCAAGRNFNSSFMNKVSEEKDTPYTLRSGKNILAPKQGMTEYGIEKARFLGVMIWHTMPSSLRVPNIE